MTKSSVNKKDEIMILLDLDGVIVSWLKGAANVCGIDLENKEIRDKIKSGSSINLFLENGEKELWENIDKYGSEWWRNLEKFSWSDKLIKLLMDKSSNFCFLTSPSNNPFCVIGKIMWLKDNMGSDFKNFLIGKDKHFCANSRSILIDDNVGKIKKFDKYGGNVFKWPNELSLIDGDINIEDTLKSLSKKIDNIKEKLNG